MILIVDDNRMYVDRIIRLLDDIENIGLIKVAGNYEEGYRIFSLEKPDLVLLDINLPDQSGIKMLTHIRKTGWPCKVIMISNHADEFYRRQCKELGADYFLDKTNEFGLLPGIIENLNTPAVK